MESIVPMSDIQEFMTLFVSEMHFSLKFYLVDTGDLLCSQNVKLFKSFLFPVLFIFPHQAAVNGLSLSFAVHFFQYFLHQVFFSSTTSGGYGIKRFLFWHGGRPNRSNKFLRRCYLSHFWSLTDGVIDWFIVTGRQRFLNVSQRSFSITKS